MDVVSLFAGIGGFDLAFERAGATVTLQSELEPHCQKLLARRFPGIELIPDVCDVVKPEADIIVGGFPCQDISVAGRRAGLAGDRSGLWYEFARILDESRPAWCVIENVAGLLSSNSGRDLGTILGALGDIGYGFTYRVLDAQFFGVPQRRRRVFIVGCLGDARRAGEILLEPEGGCWNPSTRGEARADVAPTLAARTRGGGWPGTDEAADGYVIPAEPGSGVVNALTASGLGGGGPDDNLAQAGHLVAAQCHGNNVGPIGTLRAGNGGITGGVPFVGGPIAFHVTQDPITSETRFPSMSTGNKDGCATLGVAQPLGVRKLMPIECERLQGFPDGWTDGFADTTRYRMLGNAVAVPVVEWIARRMMAASLNS